jgi:hypothetical protein
MAKIVTIEQETTQALVVKELYANRIIDRKEARDMLGRLPNFEGIGKKLKAKK